jgi:hypothetical protein
MQGGRARRGTRGRKAGWGVRKVGPLRRLSERRRWASQARGRVNWRGGEIHTGKRARRKRDEVLKREREREDESGERER